MKQVTRIIFSIVLLLLSACAFFDTTQAVHDPAAPSGQLAVPVGKNWQLIEEAPKLSDERGRLPFQTEQYLLPDGATRPAAPAENRTIKTPQ